MWLSYVFSVCTHKLRRERECLCDSMQRMSTRADPSQNYIVIFPNRTSTTARSVLHNTRVAHLRFAQNRQHNTTEHDLTHCPYRTIRSEWKTSHWIQSKQHKPLRAAGIDLWTIDESWIRLTWELIDIFPDDWRRCGRIDDTRGTATMQCFCKFYFSSAVVVSSICASIDCMWWSLVSSVFMYVR